MFIGITGKSGSGKSTLAKLYEKLGYERISIDEIGWEVIDEVKDVCEKIYGTSDRKKIGEQLFRDRNKYKAWTKSVWEGMEKKIDERIKDKKDVVFDFLLLPRTKYFNMCDTKILIRCNFLKRMFRVIKRDKISLRYFLLREKNSIDFDNKDFDCVIENLEIRRVNNG